MKAAAHPEAATPLEVAAQWGTVATAIVAVLALVIAWYQISASRKTTREATATQLFNQSLMLSLQYPRFGDPDEYSNFTKSEKNKYEWFVSAVMLAYEEILINTDGNIEWVNSIEANLRFHWNHLIYLNETGYDFERYYAPELVEIVSKIIREFGGRENA